MDLKKALASAVLAVIIVLPAAGCNSSGTSTSVPAETERPAGWTEVTHGNDTEPDYSVVFPQDAVNQIVITIAPEDWEAMQADMAGLFGTQGTQQGGGQPGVMDQRPGGGGMLPDSGNNTMPRRPGEGIVPGTDNTTLNQPPGVNDQGVPGWVDMTSENPEWVPATVEFNGLTWTDVGIRYKGNSSLTSTWRSGSSNLPFKLDFDQFEDEYPAIKNQRFYGFKQLSFSNAFNDGTYMRDTLGSYILADAGLPAAKTAYYEVILDYGEGEVSLGLYIAIEVVDDTVINRVFGGDSGNIYEGDGQGVSLAEGTYNRIQSSFLKENNEQESDWSDIQELYTVLHSDTRTTDSAAWRQSLESVFNVDSFLEWLAAAAIIQHWDTYGSMTHNFYLYNDPDTGLLTWISWDHNQILENSGGIGAAGGRPVGGIRAGRTLSLGREEVTEQWPLIRFLLDDPVYYERYTGYIEDTINGAFNPEKITEKIQALAELIKPYVVEESGTATFESAVQELINRVNERYQAAVDFLAEGE